MSNSRPTRDGFGEGIVELGKTNPNVVVLCADLTDSTRASWFRDKYPRRFFGMGVAEQDMFSTAAGMALAGKIPFACTFGVFASGRAWDQARVSISYMNLPVKIIGSHGGISVGPDGATHQALEEISLMRPLANMAIVVPCDFLEAKKATIEAASWPGPVYLRFGRSPVPAVTKEQDVFKIGRACVIKDGKDVSIMACGIMVNEAVIAAEELKKEGIDARIVNIHTPKPLDEEEVLNSAKMTRAIVTAEEHTLAGGLGSAISEFISTVYPVPIQMVGVHDSFGESGAPEELFDKFGLKAKHIVLAAKKAVKMKKLL